MQIDTYDTPIKNGTESIKYIVMDGDKWKTPVNHA